MDYFDTEKIKEVIITFENFQRMHVDKDYINILGVERTKLPANPVSDYEVCQTCVTLDKEVYRSPDILDRLRQYRDITWFEVIFQGGESCIWGVPWEDDPQKEDENILQHNNECVDGISIYIEDYRIFN